MGETNKARAALTPTDHGIEIGSTQHGPRPGAEGGQSMAWRHPDEIPAVPPGRSGYFWVAVRRKDGRVRSFPAQYLNAMLLRDEWGDYAERSGNRFHHGPTTADEGSFPASGWHVEKEHGEYDGIYSPLLDDTDELVAWRAVADYPNLGPAPHGPAPIAAWPSGVLNRNDTLRILVAHNAWRRGAGGPQTDPRMLGLALDAVIAAISSPTESVALAGTKGEHGLG